MAKITLQITQKELDGLENLSIAWNLCDKHKTALNASEEDYFHFTQTCKKCKKINKEISITNLHLWSKLVTAYLKTAKNKKS